MNYEKLLVLFGFIVVLFLLLGECLKRAGIQKTSSAKLSIPFGGICKVIWLIAKFPYTAGATVAGWFKASKPVQVMVGSVTLIITYLVIMYWVRDGFFVTP